MNFNRSGGQYSLSGNESTPVSVLGNMIQGKYKGKSITKVPTNYLEWMIANFRLSSTGKYLIQKELNTRL